MLTHDSPRAPYCTEPVADVMLNNPNDWPDSILAYAEDGIDKVTRAVIGVTPLLRSGSSVTPWSCGTACHGCGRRSTAGGSRRGAPGWSRRSPSEPVKVSV